MSLDGLADYVFCGPEAERVAHALNAPRLGRDEFGWRDVPEDLAHGRGVEVEEYRQRQALKLGTDFRPHSHHWRVTEPTKSSPTESGMAEVGEATVCNFLTSWGDGLFDVYRDVGRSGSLFQIRIEFCETSTASAR